VNDNALLSKISLPMRWLALAAAVEMGLVVLAATAVHSKPVHASSADAASPSPLIGHARPASDAAVRTETVVREMADPL
jgi:hypothetical protein